MSPSKRDLVYCMVVEYSGPPEMLDNAIDVVREDAHDRAEKRLGRAEKCATYAFSGKDERADLDEMLVAMDATERESTMAEYDAATNPIAIVHVQPQEGWVH